MKILMEIITKHDRFWFIRLLIIKVSLLLLVSIPLQILLLNEFSALYVIYAITGLIIADIMLFNHYYERDQLYLLYIILIIFITKVLSLFSFSHILLAIITICVIVVLLNSIKSYIKIYSVILFSFILSIFLQKSFKISNVYDSANFALYFFIYSSCMFWMDKVLSSLYEHVWRLTSNAYLEQIINVINGANISSSKHYDIFSRLKLIKNEDKYILAAKFYDDLVTYSYFIYWLRKSELATASNFDNIVNDLERLQTSILNNRVVFNILPNDDVEHMQNNNELFNNVVNSWNALCK